MPVPGVTRVDHFGSIVPNLDDARAFFVDVLGLEYPRMPGPLRGGRGHWMSGRWNSATAPRSGPCADRCLLLLQWLSASLSLVTY